MEASLDDENRDTQTSEDPVMNLVEVCNNQEPYEGMSFESEKAAREFYENYASQEGFITRVISSRKSEQNGLIISRGLGCRGLSFGRTKTSFEKQDRQNSCTAMILFRREKDGQWIVRKFVKDHNHPVRVDMENTPISLDDKDRKIQELTAEVRVKKRLSASYREQLETLLKDIEGHSEHVSKRIRSVNETLRKLDAEMGKHSKKRKGTM